MADLPEGLPGWIREHIELYLTDPEKAHLIGRQAAGGRLMAQSASHAQQAKLLGAQHRLGPALHAELDEDVLQVGLDGLGPQPEVPGDGLVRSALRDQGQDLAFPG